MTGTDLLDDVTKNGGGSEPVAGTLKPADIVRMEQEAQDKENGGADPNAAKPGESGEPAATTADVDIDALLAKVEKGDELSEEEAVVYAEIVQTKPDEPEAPETYVIKGETFTYEEMNARMRKENGIGEVKMAKAGEKKLVEMFVAVQNKAEANRAIDKGYRENAAERQRIADDRMKLQVERQSLLRTKELVAKQLNDVKALMTLGIEREDLDRNAPDYEEKLMQYQDKMRAQQQFKSLNEELQAADEAVRENAAELVRQDIAGFQEAHPEYKMSEPYAEIANKMRQGITVDPQDKMKMMEIYEFLSTAQTRQVPVEEIYEYRKAAKTLAVQPVAQAPAAKQLGKLLDLPSPGKDLAAQVAAYKKKLATAGPSTRGGSGGHGGDRTEKRTSRILIEEGRKYSGAQKSEFLKSEGYA